MASNTSRRNFVHGAVQTAGVLAAGSALGALPALASANGNTLALADYEAMVGGYFYASGMDGPGSTRLKLFSMEALPLDDACEQFSLSFYGSAYRRVTPGRYALRPYRGGQYFEAYLELTETKWRRQWYRADFALMPTV